MRSSSAARRARVIGNVTFHGCDILRTSNICGDIAGALAIICLDDTLIRNVRFENLRVEHPIEVPINFFFAESMFTGQIAGTKQPDGGTLRDVLVHDVSFTGGAWRRSFLRSLDARHVVENVRFRNLAIHGWPIRSVEAGRFVINEFTRDVRFE